MHLFTEIMAVLGAVILVGVIVIGGIVWFIDSLPPGSFP